MANQDPSSLTGFDESAGVAPSDIKPDWMERVGPLLSPKHGGAMDKMLAQHHAQRLEQARIHKELLHNSTLALTKIVQGFDPETGEKFATPRARAEAAQKYKNRYDYAMEQFKKSAGISPEAKKGIDALDIKLKMIINGGVNPSSPEAQPPQPGQPQQSPAPATPQTPPPDTPPKAEGGGRATAAPSAGTQAAPTPPPGPQPPIINGKATAGGGGEITNAGGTRWTTPPRKPTPMPDTDIGTDISSMLETNDPEGRLDAGELRRSLALDQNLQMEKRKVKGEAAIRLDQAEEWAKQGVIDRKSPEFKDYVMFNKAPTAASFRLGSAVESELQAARDAKEAGDDASYEQHMKTASSLATAKKGEPKRTPAQQEQQRALELLHSGDEEGAAKAIENAKKLGSAKGSPENMNTWTATAITGTPEEKKIAKEKIALWARTNADVGAARFIAGARERAKYNVGTYIDPDTNEQVPMSAFDVVKAAKAGKNYTKIGPLSAAQVSAVDKFDREAFPAIDEVRKYLKAYDNENDRLIFARVMDNAGPAVEGEEAAWVGNVLNQVAQENLSEDGQHLVVRLKRLNQTSGEMRAALNLPATNDSQKIIKDLMPGATTWNSAIAGEILDQFEFNARNAITIPILRGVTPGAGKQQSTIPGAKKSPRQTAPPETSGGHSFTYNGQQYKNVPDALYQKFKDKPGFKE